MSGFFVLAADGLVAVLLVATIASSVRLSGRIATLKGDEAALRATIGELLGATEKAERAVAGLRAALSEGERAFGTIRVSEQQVEKLRQATAAGETVLDRIEAIAGISRQFAGLPPEPAAMARPAVDGDAIRVVTAAAQALADRVAGRGGSRAT